MKNFVSFGSKVQLGSPFEVKTNSGFRDSRRKESEDTGNNFTDKNITLYGFSENSRIRKIARK